MSWAKCVRGVMLDISGVLKNGDIAIQGSIEAVKRLRDAGIVVRFVTNETQLTCRMLCEKLVRIGFQLTENEIFSPAPVMVKLLKERKLRPMLLVHPRASPQFEGIDQSNPNCVVVGDATDVFTYEKLNEAFRLLMEQKTASLFSLGRGRYYKEVDGLCMDVGGFTAALEYASGVRAEVVGKPEKTFFATALSDMALSKSEVLMIGDDIVSDVGGAQEFGIRGVLVRTGKFIAEKDENHPLVKPDAIVDDLAQGVDGGSPPTGPKEWTPRRRKKIRKVDIGLPKDFVHVSTVKNRKKVSVDLNDPVIQSFLLRAEVNEKDLCNPEISRVVTNFIERVGLDAIRHESETGGFLSRHDGCLSQVPVEKEGNLSVPDLTNNLDSSTKSEDDKSLIFCPEHDIEITSELDDVFSSHVDTSVSGNSDDSGEGEIDTPKTRASETSEEGKRIDHDTFLFELKAAIRKREIRVKKKLQNEEIRGEEIWSDLRPVVTSKRRVSFFEPEMSPSPKPVRTVHTRWDLTDDSSDITDIGLNEVEADGDKNTDERVHSDDSDDLGGKSTVDGAVNASGKAKLPLVGGTKALNRVLSSDNSDILSNEDQAISKLNNAPIILPGDQLLHDNTSGMQLQSEDEGVLLETESPLVEAADTNKEEITVNTGIDEIEIEMPDKSSVEVKKPIKKGGIAHWLFGKKNTECPPKIVDANVTSEEGSGNVENEVTESRVIEGIEKLGSAEKRKDDKGRKSKLKAPSRPGRTGKVENEVTESRVIEDHEKLGSDEKRKDIKGRKNKLKAPFRQEQKLVDDPKELNALSLKDITNLESPRKKEDKTSFSFFTGKKKHASVSNVSEVKLPKPSGSPTIRNSDEENNDSHGNKFDSSVNINLHAKKETDRAKRPRMAIRKKDIQVMRDMRHVTHITWDPDRRGFLLNHTDDEDLRKFLLQEKLCVEMPRYKQRRNSYSLAVDCLDSDYEDCLSKPGERRSFSLSSASRVFSRGEKKRAPLPRPKSDLPTHENVIYF